MSLRLVRYMFLCAIVMAVAVACGTAEPEPTPTPTPISGGAVDPTATPDSSEPGDPQGEDPDLTDHFAGETVEIFVGFSPGGGYDTFSRLFALYAPKYLPGEPNVVIQNLPGAGGERGLRTTMTSEPDGLKLGILHPRFISRELLGIDIEDFDLDTVRIIGSASAPTVNLLTVRRDVAETWDDVLQLGRPLRLGDTEPGASGGEAGLFIELTGGPVQQIYGYGGTSEILAAVDRGELDGSASGLGAAERLYPEWVESRFLAGIFHWGGEPTEDPALMRFLEAFNEDIPPHLFDIIDVNEDERAAFDLAVATTGTMSRTFVLPPDTPDEIVAVWRDALRQMTEDPEFVQAAETAGYTTTYASAEDMEEQLARGRAALQNPEVFDLFSQLVSPD
ncbi:MAG: hypothetical protein WD533_07485 [Dehalococcoidia bacterium]